MGGHLPYIPESSKGRGNQPDHPEKQVAVCTDCGEHRMCVRYMGKGGQYLYRCGRCNIKRLAGRKRKGK